MFRGRTADRTPTLGGWITCPQHICDLVDIDLDTYWQDPEAHSIRAYERLDVDGLLGNFVPKSRSDFRLVNIDKTESYPSLDEALDEVDRMPDPQRIEDQFDLQQNFETFKRDWLDVQAQCGEMLWMPAQWGIGARAMWYKQFGYENFFYMVAAHTDRARRLMEIGAAHGYCRARVLSQAIDEGLFPPAVLIGEDICAQNGPMVSPAFLEKYFAPHLRRGLAPLLEVGCRPVWHSDGDYRPIMDMLIDCGVRGFQGFQPECGMTIEYVASRRTREGDPLLIFGPIAVTTELPVLDAEAVRRRVRHAIEVCRGQADLVLFHGNTINPDVPLENVIAMYEAVRD